MSGRKNLKIWWAISVFLLVLAFGSLSAQAAQSGSIVAWGHNYYGQCNAPAPNSGFVAIAAGESHSLGLKEDGSVAAWGYNGSGQCNVPAPNSGFIAIAAGRYHSLGLKDDGSVAAWGANDYGQCNVPAPNSGFIAIAAGYFHSLGLKEDGSVVAWGDNDYGQCNVGAPNSGFVAIAAGGIHSLSLKDDGSVVAWGYNYYGQCNVPAPNSGFIAIAAGVRHSLGLKEDGSVAAWGDNDYGQCNVPAPNSGFIAIAAGASHSLGLKEDGSVAAWGYNSDGQCNVPPPNSGFVAIAAGGYHSLAVKEPQRTLTISSTAGGTVTDPGEGSHPYDHGTVVPITAQAEANYHFVEWTGTAVEAGKVENPSAASTTVTMDGDYTLVANFAIDQRTLTISSTSGGTVTEPGEGLFGYESGTVVPITAQAEANYHFVEWTGTAVEAGKVENPSAASTTVTMDADYTLVANFAIDQRTLTISSTAGGTTSPGEGSHQYDHGTVVPITAQAEANWQFAEWTGSAVDAGKVANPSAASTTVTMDADYTLVANFAQTVILHVDDDASIGGDGSSWATAYKYLQDALYKPPTSGDQIWVAEGTYKPDENTANPGGTGDREATFQLINGVALYGGYAGYGQPDPNERDVELYETILSGDLDGNDVQVDPCDLLTEPTRAENSYHVVTGSGTDATAILDGFTITAGNADEAEGNDSGGGMENYESSPTVTNCTFSGNSAVYGGGMGNDYYSDPNITNCTFSGNSASSYGGGMENWEHSSPTVTNCTFSGNSAVYGGGMCNYKSSPTVTNSTFTGNSAPWGGGMENYWDSDPNATNCTFTGNSAEYGGGIDNDDSSPTVTNCTFSGNSADNLGGGMENYWDSDPNIINCTFTGNSAEYGGGMENSDNSDPNVTNCTFSENYAAEDGGGIDNDDSSPTVTNCTFSGNSADNLGGGMCNWSSSSPTVTNCTFTGNSAPWGGGMDNYDNSSPTLTNCTFSGNSAEEDGGGMENYPSSSPTLTNCTFSGNSAGGYGGGMDNWDSSNPTVSNCVFWGNTAPSGAQIYNSGTSSPTVTYCDVQGGWSGTGNINADPLFVDASNPDPNLRDYHLRPGSPCIDAGDNTAVPPDTADLDGDGNTTEPIPWDIDTDVRISDGTVDMGSDEVIWDGAEDIDPGGSVTLNPGGGPNDPNTEALVVFDNNSAGDANITVVEMGSTAHPKVQGFQALGKTLRIETSLADGEFFMTVSIPFDSNDLAGADPFTVDLMYWEDPPGKWRHAVRSNTDPKRSNPKENRWQEEYPPTSAPSLVDLKAKGMGANGVFWNSETQQGFVWANVDHTTDFEGLAHNIADFEPDGDVDFVDFAWFAPNWMDTACGTCDGADLTYDGNVGLDDLRKFTDNWLAGK